MTQQCHTGKIFTGENAFHILCVNKREEQLCECIELAASRLKERQLQSIFWKQARPSLFGSPPRSSLSSPARAHSSTTLHSLLP